MDTLADLTPDFLCTDVSVAMDEALYGTAAFATTWFILEYRQSWRPKAPHDNDLPEHIQQWLNQQVSSVTNGRLQFIRKGRGQEGQPINFYIALTHETSQQLFHFELENYDALLSLDMPTILAGNAKAHLTTEPLVLVCTHGRRDRCCALLGLPILNALKAELGEAVWQTTHTGGHRFAPTLVTFPDGVCYGRITAEDVPPLISALQNKALLLEKLRGRTCYGVIEQVADYLLRHETGQSTLHHYQYIKTEAANTQWVVTFAEPTEEQLHTITLEQDPNPLSLYASSGSYKLKDVPQFTFIAHDVSLYTDNFDLE